jgi:hypothetical protein
VPARFGRRCSRNIAIQHIFKKLGFHVQFDPQEELLRPNSTCNRLPLSVAMFPLFLPTLPIGGLFSLFLTVSGSG